MVRALLIEHLWAGMVLVTALYLLDYRLSILGVKWFHRGADKHYSLGGSYELNQPFVDDIDAQRSWSIKHLVAVARIWLVLAIVWFLTVRIGRLDAIYEGLLGFFVLAQIPVQMRHVQNLMLFRTVALKGGVSGRTEGSRWLDQRMAAVLFWFFGGAYLLLWALTNAALFLGGTAGGLLLGARFWIFAEEAEEAVTQPMEPDELAQPAQQPIGSVEGTQADHRQAERRA